MAAGPYLAIVLKILTGAFFLFVGQRLMLRFETSPEARRAIMLFGLYWALLGVSALLRGLLLGLAVLDPQAFGGWLEPLFIVAHALLLLGLCGFMYYLAYIFLGRHGAAWGVFGLYALFGLGQLWLVAQGDLAGELTDFRYPFYPSEASVFFPYWLAYILAVVPFLLGTFGIMFLGLRTGRPRTRYRGILVGSALLFWAVASVADYTLRVQGPVELAPEIVAFAAALAVYLAYFPPRFIEAKLDAMSPASAPATQAPPEG